MRKALIVCFLAITISLSGATYYVSTSGSDSNPGTIDRPFATWQKGFSTASPGDIVYVRGGTYYPKGVSGRGAYAGVFIEGKNGTSSNPINVWAYPGETPILDCRNMTQSGNRMGIYLYNADYWHLKGLSVTRVDQHSSGNYISSGVRIYDGNNNKLELIKSYDNGGSGISVVYASEGNYVLNCDSYNNYDRYTGGDNADGIEVSFIVERNGNERLNTIRGCRAWDNSDDGFDHFRGEGILIIDKCWVWHNGVIPGSNTQCGDGNGFKLGGTFGTKESVVQRTITNCIAYNHRQNGFSQQSAEVKMIFHNNTTYKNGGYGYEFIDYNMADIIRNNISYKDNATTTYRSNQTSDHNSWQGGISVSDSDFESLDASQLMHPRKSDGSLPDITFLNLASGSDMVDKGVNVGLPYSGSAPDLGAFERGGTVAQPAIPQYVSSAVENSTPSVITMTYNLSLANIVPALSSFSVQVNSSPRNVTAVAVSGTTVRLTLSSPVTYGNTVTVSYTAPSSNPLQTSAGGKAESISNRSVTNRISAPAAVPVYQSSAVENAAPSVIVLTYNLSLANIVPATSAFSVHVNSSARNVTAVAVSGTSVRLTLASPVAYGNTVTVSYSVPSSNPLQTSAGGRAESISNRSVTNRVSAPTAIPVFTGASVENSAPSVIVMNYDLALTTTTPSASAFAVSVNSSARTVSSVAVSGTQVRLTLSSPVVYGNTVVLAYNKPSSSPLQTSAGGVAASFSSQTVTNRVNPVITNNPPVVNVNYAKNISSGFVGTINASGSYDANKDKLTYSWKVPGNIPVSSTSGAVIEFLAPIVETKQTYNFSLTVSDGKSPQTKTVPIEVEPYQPGLDIAKIVSVDPDNPQTPDMSYNIIDGNISTAWSAAGVEQSIILELAGPFNVQYVTIAFQPGYKKEFFFDIYGSNDRQNWEPILVKSKSCAFSGNLQTFDFPATKADKEFRYVKIVGLGNSTDDWNYISELIIFGHKHRNPADYEEHIVKLYPNPAREMVNIRIDEPTFNPDFIKIHTLAGKVIYTDEIDPVNRELQIPVSFKPGIYIVQMGTGEITVFTQKLIVTN